MVNQYRVHLSDRARCHTVRAASQQDAIRQAVGARLVAIDGVSPRYANGECTTVYDVVVKGHDAIEAAVELVAP